MILAHYCSMDVVQVWKDESLHRTEAWWRAVTSRPSVVKTGVPAEEVIRGSERLLSMMRARK